MEDNKRDETPEAIRAAAEKAALVTAGLAVEKALDEAMKQARASLAASYNRARGSLIENITVADNALDEALEQAHASRWASAASAALDDALEQAHASRRAALAAEHDEGQMEELADALEQAHYAAIETADDSAEELVSAMVAAREAAREAANAAREAMLSAPQTTEWEEVNAASSSVWGQLESVAAALENAFKTSAIAMRTARNCFTAARKRTGWVAQDRVANSSSAPEAYKKAARQTLEETSPKARKAAENALLKTWRAHAAARKAAWISAEAAWRLRRTDGAETARAVYALAEASVSLAYEALKSAYAARNDAAIATEYLRLWTATRGTLALCRANENETPQTHLYEQST